MTNPVCACGNPLRNHAEFCRDCEHWARRRLADQVFYRDQLLTELVKQTAKHAPSEGGHSFEQPLPFSDRAGELLRRQEKWLASWVETVVGLVPPIAGPVCANCRHPNCRTIRDSRRPAGTISAASCYLENHLRAIRHHPDGARFIRTLRTLAGQILGFIDLQDRRITLGPCPEMIPDPDQPGHADHCPGECVALVPADESVPVIIRCKACGAEWPSTQWNRAGDRIIARATQLAKQRQLAQAIGGTT